MSKLLFPVIEYSYDFKKENEELRRNAEPLWGDSVIYTCPTTIRVTPYKDYLNLVFNGQGHNNIFNIPIPNKSQYEKIYNSIKKQIDKYGTGFFPMESNLEIYPDKFKPKSLDLLSKQELLNLLKSGYSHRELNYFDSSMFNITPQSRDEFMEYINGQFIKNKCFNYKLSGLQPTTNMKFNDVLQFNKDIIQNFINKNKLKHISKITLINNYITSELSTTDVVLKCAK